MSELPETPVEVKLIPEVPRISPIGHTDNADHQMIFIDAVKLPTKFNGSPIMKLPILAEINQGKKIKPRMDYLSPRKDKMCMTSFVL